jgi:uncharacterized protein
MKFKIYEDKSGEWRWRLKAANGRTVADSGEGYASRNNVIRAVNRVIESVRDMTNMGK